MLTLVRLHCFILRFICLQERERRVKRTQLLDVASSHASLIKIFQFVLEGSADLHYCFYIRGRVGIELKYPNVFHFELLRLIKSMFPLHVSDASTCEYFLCLEEYCRNAVGGKEIETKLKICCCLFPPPFMAVQLNLFLEIIGFF